MFSRKKDTAKISDKTPVFHVRYIGILRRLKVAVHINPMGISLRDAEKREEEVKQDFRIEDISFCNTDRAVNERIFSWICRNQQEGRLDCHAVLCSTKQKAQTMAIVLSRAFQIAYKDWRAHHRNRDAGKSGTKNSNTSNGASLNGSRSKNSLNVSPSASQASSSPVAPRRKSKDTNRALTTNTPNVTNAPMTSSPIPGSTSVPTAMPQHTPATHRSTHEAVTVFSGNHSPQPVTSSPRQDRPSTSSAFMSSSILDPDVEEAIRGVDNLQADFDLEDSDTD